MSKLIVFESLTLDGVIQAPGRPGEDRRGGFQYGGWAAPYADPVSASMAGEGNSRSGALLFGRRTYEDFYKVWPSAPQPNPFQMCSTTPRNTSPPGRSRSRCLG